MKSSFSFPGNELLIGSGSGAAPRRHPPGRDRALAGEGHHGGVGGIEVGTILLDQAIRRSQERELRSREAAHQNSCRHARAV